MTDIELEAAAVAAETYPMFNLGFLPWWVARYDRARNVIDCRA